MSLEVCVLASGSSGNCTAVRSPGGLVLIDCGIGPRLTAQRLAQAGAASGGARDIAGVCLTHLDRDHLSCNWFSTFAKRGMPLYCHASKVAEVIAIARSCGVTLEVRSFGAGTFEPAGGLTLRAISFAHDADGSHGFVIEGFGGRVGYATDLGHVPEMLVEAFAGVDVLAIESNYDPQMQMDSPRPWFLKNRIMGGRGHLSNAQALDAVRRVLDRCVATESPLPAHVVLLHRSRQCNCPDLLRRHFSRDARIAPRLVLAEQDRPTEWLRATREKPWVGSQLQLAFG